jgi:hypothetical protein
MVKCKLCEIDYRGEEHSICGDCQIRILRSLGLEIPEFDEKKANYVGAKETIDRFLFLDRFVHLLVESIDTGNWNTELIKTHQHSKRTIDVVLDEKGHDV